MPGIWALEFLNRNSQIRYPISEDSDVTDVSDSFVIPDDFLVELDLPVSTGLDVNPGQFFIKNLGAYVTGYAIVVGYQPASGPAVDVASAFIPAAGFTRNSLYTLGGIAPFDDSTGKVVIGSLDNISLQPPGYYTFALADTRLEPDGVRPIINGISGLVVVQGAQQSQRITGDIYLVAGNNVEIFPILVDGQDPVLVFNVIDGAGTIEECVCTNNNVSTSPILTINGIGPDNSGNFTVLGSDCLQINPVANGIQLNDICSQPCCSCVELERITQDLERFGSQAAALQLFVNQLNASVTAFDQIVLGARLGDRGCTNLPLLD